MMKFLSQNKWIAALGVLFVLGFGALSVYGYVNGLRSEGIRQETALSAQFEANQNELSGYTLAFYEQLGIANLKSAKLDTILTHAIEGRYGEDGFSANGAFFSAITESYPDLTQNMQLYDDIVVFVRAGREAFKNKQDKLLDQSRVYKNFLNDGLIRSRIVKGVLGFPSDVLEARIGGQVVARGPAAFDRLQTIVVTGSTAEAFTTGRQEALTIK